MMRSMGYYNHLARKLARGGRYRVVLVTYPERPEVFEYISRAGKRLTRYININAQADANICVIVTR